MEQRVHQTCGGCGIGLQAESPAKPGYVPAGSLEQPGVVCRRCFRIRHYNEVSSSTLSDSDFLNILSRISGTDSLVVHIVDIFDFEGSLISSLPRFVGRNPVVLAVNKMDLLPKALNPNKVRNWVQQQAKELGLKPVEVVLCSAKRNIGFDQVIRVVESYRRGRDVYVVGAANVGKSSLINRLIQDYSDLERELTISRYPGTTLDMVQIPLEDGCHIIDTPGILYPHRLTELVNPADLEALMPDDPIKQRVFQLNPGQTLFFGALARFDFIEGDRQSFTCYMSNAMDIHRTKLERAAELYAEHKGEMLAPPNRERLEQLPPWTVHSLRIPKGAEFDVFISGLGWIAVNGTTGANLAVHAPKGVRVLTRRSMI